MDILQATADALSLRLIVHFVNGPVINYQSNAKSSEEAKTIHLECNGGVHFNALIPKTVERIIGINQVQAVELAEFNVPPLHLKSTTDELRQWQTRDDDISELVRKVRASARRQAMELSDNLRCYKPKFKKLSLQDGLLVCELNDSIFLPVVPESSIQGLAEELHLVLSHAGRDKTLTVMNTKFYHPKFHSTILNVVKSCSVCQEHKGKIDRSYPIYRRQVKEPYQVLAVDLMELPLSKRHYKCVLVCLDLCTKYAHVVPLKSKKSAVVSRALESRVLVSVPRTPIVILSDNGSEFRGGPFESLLQRYGIKHEYSVPYVAATNGGVERFNQTLRSRLATVTHGDTRSWDRHLYTVVSQYNRTPHSETNRAPCEFFVKEAEINIPNKTYWKPPKNFQPFKVGELILRKVPYQPAGERDKLAPRFEGPLKIVEADPNGVVYKAQWVAAPQKVIQLHITQIKRYFPPESMPERAPMVPAMEPGVPKIAQQSPKRPFNLNWDNLLLFSATEAPPPAILGAVPVNYQANAGNQSSLAGSIHPEVELSLLASPEPVLSDNQDSDIGSWPVSPEVEDIISDNCEVRVSTSTPRRRVPTPPDSPPVRPIPVPEPGPSCLGRTRQQTRRLQQAAIAEEAASRPRSSSESEQFYSDESSVFRGDPERPGLSGTSLLAAHSMVGPNCLDNNLIIINNTQEAFNITIEGPTHFHSLVRISRDDFRWTDQDPSDTLD